MANKGKWIGILVMVLVFGIFLSSCATNVGPHWENRWFVNQMEPGRHDYTILGEIIVEKTWFGILGLGVPFLGDAFLFQSGGVNHGQVLNEARRRYPTANAVININVSCVQNTFGPFFANRRYTVTGFAVRYYEEQRNARINSGQ